MGPGVLKEIVGKLPKFSDDKLLVGFDTSDDACVYRLRDDLVIVQTVDFFPPMVDDPFTFGQIAAANALSDIYAMGAEPTLALNLLCFPACLDASVMEAILAGGADKVKEAGAIIAGGHSIRDEEPKYGLCVSGFAHPDAIWSNAAAREGDALILTKPLGSGVNNTAHKAELLTDEQFAPTVAAMTALNKYARDAARGADVHACTDITGFGLIGHAAEMAEGSGKTVEFFAGALPLLPHALEMAEMGMIPGGTYQNRDYIGDRVSIGARVPLPLCDILFDPQTSGGLLLSVAAEGAEALLAKIRAVCPEAAIVGWVLARDGAAVRVEG